MINNNVSISSKEEFLTWLTIHSPLKLGGGVFTITQLSGYRLPSNASAGEFVYSGYYVGAGPIIKTEFGKNVPYNESGELEKNFVFVMPAENVVVVWTRDKECINMIINPVIYGGGQ